MPIALTNINVNGRWYDAGTELADECSEEELADLDDTEGTLEWAAGERESTLGEDKDTSPETDEGNAGGDDAQTDDKEDGQGV